MIDMNLRKASRLQIMNFLMWYRFYKSTIESNTLLSIESNDTLDDNPLKVVYINACNLQGGTHDASLLTLIDCHGQTVTWCIHPRKNNLLK